GINRAPNGNHSPHHDQ
ncbi:phosphoenolpyruvate carboxylase family protein, partial [Vibrio parahaemolyticus V-223/04]